MAFRRPRQTDPEKPDPAWHEMRSCPRCGQPARAATMDAHLAGPTCEFNQWQAYTRRIDWVPLPKGKKFLARSAVISWEIGPTVLYGDHLERGIWTPRWVAILAEVAHTGRIFDEQAERLARSEELRDAICAAWELAESGQRRRAVCSVLGLPEEDGS